MFNVDNTNFLWRPVAATFYDSLSLKISPEEPSKTSKRFSNCQMNSNPEIWVKKCSSYSPSFVVLVDYVDKNRKLT